MNESSLAARAAVIGLGNVLLGDDAFGPFTIELFRSEYECGPEVEIIDLGTPGLDLAPYLYGRDLVIIVDAVNAEGKPGTVRTYGESDFSESQVHLRLTDHDPGLHESLTQLRLAGRDPTQLIIVGAVPESCALGEAISPTIWAAGSIAIEVIVQLLLERGYKCHRRHDRLHPQLWWTLTGSPRSTAELVSSESDFRVDSRHA
jgi:hydrogenase maturation protease